MTLTREQQLQAAKMMMVSTSLMVLISRAEFPSALTELGRVFRVALDAAAHGPGALELGRWADDGGYVPD